MHFSWLQFFGVMFGVPVCIAVIPCAAAAVIPDLNDKPLPLHIRGLLLIPAFLILLVLAIASGYAK
jgi:hypothetical protein